MLSYILQAKIVVDSNLRLISRPNFMLSRVEHEKRFITSGPGLLKLTLLSLDMSNVVNRGVSQNSVTEWQTV